MAKNTFPPHIKEILFDVDYVDNNYDGGESEEDGNELIQILTTTFLL